MKGNTSAKTIDEYLDSLEEPRKSDIAQLHNIIREEAPQLEPTMAFGMPGYGSYHYRYKTGREGDWPRISMASQKNYISLYVTCTDEGKYLAESFVDELPKASIGKSCIRFKRLEDVDTDVIRHIIRRAAELHQDLEVGE